MLTANRTLLIASCLAMVAAAACGGGGPTAPSASAGTTITGTVRVNGGAATLPGAAAASMTVTVVGTSVSAVVETSGYFQLVSVPSGTVRLLFKDAFVNATVELSNVGQQPLIEIQVQVTGSTAVVVSDVRSDTKVSLCHRSDDTGYHLITVSDSAEPAHRAHGDGKVGDPVPAQPTMVFNENCQPVGPSVRIEKSTNGEDADDAPGPTILVGNPVNWQYVVTNTGTINLTDVVVADDHPVTVSCPGTTLSVGQSMTCTGSGLATAGQYRNVGTVTAKPVSGSITSVSDTDASHYFGLLPEEGEDGPKVQLCHRTGAGFYVPIEVSISAEPAHLAHGDGRIGQAVPGAAGKVFGPGCSVL